MARRVCITGIGLVTPLGVGVEPVWQALVSGRSGAGPITQFDTQGHATTIACEVDGFDPEPWLERRLSKTLDRFIQLGLVAALMARDDAALGELTDAELERVGVFVTSGMGGLGTLERTHLKVLDRGPRRGISPYFIPSIIINLLAGQISIMIGARGPNLAHVTACSASAHAVGEAARCIQRGDADLMFAGGAESTVTPLAIGGFNAMKALSRRNDDPAGASRPFDVGRDGFVMGEGAGVLVLEELSRARRRGATVYAEVAGYNLNADAHHITAPSPNGAGAQRCMALALEDAGVRPDEVDYINAHGTSTRYNDIVETGAIRAVFGDHADRLAVSSTKSMTGHLLGASGGMEAAFTALALQRGVIPPTINLQDPDPLCDLDYTANTARPRPLATALSNSFGFGGTNACLVLRRADPPGPGGGHNNGRREA